MNVWDEVLAENASDAECQMNEPCRHCGVRLGDHYTTRGLWVPCELVTPGLVPDGDERSLR